MTDYFWDHWMGHALSLMAMLGAMLGLLPAIAAGLAAVYYVIQIYESVTVKGLITRWRTYRTTKRVKKLRAELKRLEPPAPLVLPPE